MTTAMVLTWSKPRDATDIWGCPSCANARRRLGDNSSSSRSRVRALRSHYGRRRRPEKESMEKKRILLADDHVLFRKGLAQLLATQPDFQVIGEANDGLEALAKARELMPDLILLD